MSLCLLDLCFFFFSSEMAQFFQSRLLKLAPGRVTGSLAKGQGRGEGPSRPLGGFP